MKYILATMGIIVGGISVIRQALNHDEFDVAFMLAVSFMFLWIAKSGLFDEF